MRRPRRRQPGQFLDITVRCQRSEFRLLPTEDRKNILGFWIAKAQKMYPGVLIFGLSQMGNHAHLVVHDQRGGISGFMQYALGQAAKRINQLDRLHGSVFERRFAEIAVADCEALAARVAYVVTNPVAANLVESHEEWSGLCAFAG